MKYSYRSIGQSWVGSAIALFILSIFIVIAVILMEDSMAIRQLEAETVRTQAQTAATQAQAEAKFAQAAAAQADAELARANGERAILEAAAVSLPLVLSDNASYEDYLYDHYLKANSEDGLAEIIDHLYRDQSHYVTWQREADLLAERYEITSFIEQLTQYYNLVARS